LFKSLKSPEKLNTIKTVKQLARGHESAMVSDKVATAKDVTCKHSRTTDSSVSNISICFTWSWANLRALESSSASFKYFRSLMRVWTRTTGAGWRRPIDNTARLSWDAQTMKFSLQARLGLCNQRNAATSCRAEI